VSITVIYHGMSNCTVSVSLWRVICLSQWFIMLCLWLYCISITMKSDMSITVIYHAMSLTVLYQYHYEEWYVYHSDLSCYVSDCTVSVSLWRVICLSQWFIMLCLWLYCISITMKSDMSITVIYHAISLTVLYQYHYEEWYVYHSDLSWYVFDCTLSLCVHTSWFKMILLFLQDSWTGRDLASFLHRKDVVTVNSSFTTDDHDRFDSHSLKCKCYRVVKDLASMDKDDKYSGHNHKGGNSSG
jgi:hypothetical protein